MSPLSAHSGGSAANHLLMDERCCLGGVGLVLALRDAQRHGEAEQHESKDTDGKANEQHGRYCIRKNDCRKPKAIEQGEVRGAKTAGRCPTPTAGPITRRAVKCCRCRCFILRTSRSA